MFFDDTAEESSATLTFAEYINLFKLFRIKVAMTVAIRDE